MGAFLAKIERGVAKRFGLSEKTQFCGFIQKSPKWKSLTKLNHGIGATMGKKHTRNRIEEEFNPSRAVSACDRDDSKPASNSRTFFSDFLPELDLPRLCGLSSLEQKFDDTLAKMEDNGSGLYSQEVFELASFYWCLYPYAMAEIYCYEVHLRNSLPKLREKLRMVFRLSTEILAVLAEALGLSSGDLRAAAIACIHSFEKDEFLKSLTSRGYRTTNWTEGYFDLVELDSIEANSKRIIEQGWTTYLQINPTIEKNNRLGINPLDVSSQIKKDSISDNALSEEFVFIASGDSWIIRGFGEEGTFHQLKGLRYIHEIMRSGERGKVCLDLEGKEYPPDSNIRQSSDQELHENLTVGRVLADDLLDEDAIEDYELSLKCIDKQIQEAEQSGKCDEMEKLKKEKEEILEYKKKDTRPDGKSKTLIDDAKKSADRVRKNIDYALKVLRKRKCSKIALYLDQCIMRDVLHYSFVDSSEHKWKLD